MSATWGFWRVPWYVPPPKEGSMFAESTEDSDTWDGGLGISRQSNQ